MGGTPGKALSCLEDLPHVRSVGHEPLYSSTPYPGRAWVWGAIPRACALLIPPVPALQDTSPRPHPHMETRAFIPHTPVHGVL